MKRRLTTIQILSNDLSKFFIPPLTEESVEKLLDDNVDAWIRTGSYFTVDPPVQDTDKDYCCLIRGSYYKFPDFIYSEGWKKCGNASYSTPVNFIAFRNNEFNLIFVKNDYWFIRWKRATKICKERNLKLKEERVALFSDVFTNFQKYQTIKPIEWV